MTHTHILPSKCQSLTTLLQPCDNLPLSLSLTSSLPPAIPPVLTHGDLLRDQLVLSGSTVVFPCTASGAPTPTYTWTKAGLSQPININAESE